MLVCSALHGEISKPELVVFNMSLCSHGCCYQPPKGLLKCFGITITQCSIFPHLFNVNRLNCITYQCLSHRCFEVLSGCFESLSWWVINDTNCWSLMILNDFCCCIRCQSMFQTVTKKCLRSLSSSAGRISFNCLVTPYPSHHWYHFFKSLSVFHLEFCFFWSSTNFSMVSSFSVLL